MANAIKIDEDCISCPICIDIFKDPRNLPCGHSYCFECIDQLISNKIKNQSAAISFSCPICKVDIVIPQAVPDRKRADHYPKNYSLNSVITQQGGDGMNDASVNNSDDVSSEQDRDSDGEVDDDMDNSFVCQLHNKKFELFCTEHNEELCIMCVCLNHRMCKDVVTTEKANERNMSAVREMVGKRCATSELFRSVGECLDNMDSKLDMSAEVCHKEIDEEYERICKKISTHKEKLHDTVRLEQEHEKKKIAEQKSSVNIFEEKISNTMKRVSSCLGKTNPEIKELVLLRKNKSEIDKEMEKMRKIKDTNSSQYPQLRFTKRDGMENIFERSFVDVRTDKAKTQKETLHKEVSRTHSSTKSSKRCHSATSRSYSSTSREYSTLAERYVSTPERYSPCSSPTSQSYSPVYSPTSPKYSPTSPINLQTSSSNLPTSPSYSPMPRIHSPMLSDFTPIAPRYVSTPERYSHNNSPSPSHYSPKRKRVENTKSWHYSPKSVRYSQKYSRPWTRY